MVNVFFLPVCGVRHFASKPTITLLLFQCIGSPRKHDTHSQCCFSVGQCRRQWANKLPGHGEWLIDVFWIVLANG